MATLNICKKSWAYLLPTPAKSCYLFSLQPVSDWLERWGWNTIKSSYTTKVSPCAVLLWTVHFELDLKSNISKLSVWGVLSPIQDWNRFKNIFRIRVLSENCKLHYLWLEIAACVPSYGCISKWTPASAFKFTVWDSNCKLMWLPAILLKLQISKQNAGMMGTAFIMQMQVSSITQNICIYLITKLNTNNSSVPFFVFYLYVLSKISMAIYLYSFWFGCCH
jgi:hypothetical protein